MTLELNLRLPTELFMDYHSVCREMSREFSPPSLESSQDVPSFTLHEPPHALRTSPICCSWDLSERPSVFANAVSTVKEVTKHQQRDFCIGPADPSVTTQSELKSDSRRNFSRNKQGFVAQPRLPQELAETIYNFTISRNS